MPAPSSEIDGAWLRRLYLDERLTTTGVAARLGCGVSTVTRRLRKLGITLRPRGPRPGAGGPLRPPTWSRQIAWVVGLIATDGNLAGPGRLSITSKDVDLLQSVRRCLVLSNRLARVEGGWGTGGYRLQWGNRTFYEWLVGIGLTPRKSLTIGPLAIPDEYLPDFFRGCIDGDGTILVYTDRYHTATKASYMYTRLYVSLVSASRPFIDWMRATIDRLLGLSGAVHVKRTPRQRPIWYLRYAKTASIRLLNWMYHSSDVPCLARKRAKAEAFILGGK